MNFNAKTRPERKLEHEPNIRSKEKAELESIHHGNMQKVEYMNRINDLKLIRPDVDIKVLKLKQRELEAGNCTHPFLKQIKEPYANTLYEQEGKYLSDRTNIYENEVYNPYLLASYNKAIKPGEPNPMDLKPDEPSMSLHHSKLFAHKVFGDHEHGKRLPLEQKLNAPGHTSSERPILQQTTYGVSYNHKRFLEDHERANRPNEPEMTYRKLTEPELAYQNIALKSRTDAVATGEALANGHGEAKSYQVAKERMDEEEKRVKESMRLQFPRHSGPIPPEPYSQLYCQEKNQICEMSDGNQKREYERVYASPFAVKRERFEPLRKDLEVMDKFAKRAVDEATEREKSLAELQKRNQATMQRLAKLSINNKYEKLVARGEPDEEKALRKQVNNENKSIYRTDYEKYRLVEADQCPPNQFYNSLVYTQQVRQADSAPACSSSSSSSSLPRDLNQLQDRWSKTLAHRRFNSSHNSKSADLRDNVHSGKKIVKESPMNASRLYYEP